MNCREIIEPTVALKVLKTATDAGLENLFRCIYSLFQSDFTKWILVRYGSVSNREKLMEDAKDAFQNGLMALYRKSQESSFTLSASLKTLVFSFGAIQLMAIFKSEQRRLDKSHCVESFELHFQDDLLQFEMQDLLNQKESDLVQALNKLPKKQRDILIMRFFENQKSKDIAKKLKVSPGNVDNDSTKAYKELRKHLSTLPSFQNQPMWH